MKKMLSTFLACLFCCTFVEAFELELRIDGVKGKKGKIRAVLFQDKASFDTRDTSKAAASAEAMANVGTTVLKMKGVKSGNYAVMVLHDENEDGKLQTGMFGIPKEGVAASGWSGAGRVKFSQSVMEISEKISPLTLTLKYF